MALQQFTEFCRSHHQTTGKKFAPLPEHNNALRIFGNSQFLGMHLIRHPEVFTQHLKSSFQTKEKSKSDFEQEIAKLNLPQTDINQTLAQLKYYKYQEFFRLTIKELSNQNQEEVYRELSHLAITITKTVCEILFQNILTHYKLSKEAVGDYAILSMGKLGGLELNYSSDIDLIGFYAEDKDHGPITNHELFCKFFAKLGKLLSEKDAEGFLYRVDWDLRPEGKAGTLANSLSAMEHYYETFGEEWERQAFIKANVLLETNGLAQRFLKFLTPFVYRKSFDIKTIANIRNIKMRMMSEMNLKHHPGMDLKKSKGGIRDIEFLVQGHQLLYGGKYKKIRLHGTLPTLKAMQEANLFTKEEIKILTEGYLFLRRLESCLQMDQEQQTHLLKPDLEFRFKAAKRMGITSHDPVNELNKKLNQYQKQIAELFDEFYKE